MYESILCSVVVLPFAGIITYNILLGTRNPHLLAVLRRGIFLLRLVHKIRESHDVMHDPKP
jgi:hypothetical protein